MYATPSGSLGGTDNSSPTCNSGVATTEERLSAFADALRTEALPLDQSAGAGALVRVELGAVFGCWELRAGTGTIARERTGGAADCTITLAADATEKLLSGRLKPLSAMISGDMAVEGDRSVLKVSPAASLKRH